MADLAMVEEALVGLVALSLFPTAPYEPGAYASSVAAGGVVKIYRGWPTEGYLDADLANDKAHVAIFPEAGMTRLTTRYVPDWADGPVVAATLIASVSGQAITLSGAAGQGQVVGVQFGVGPQLQAYIYRLTGADTLATAAAGLAAKIMGAASSGPVVTLPAYTVQPVALVVSDQLASIELRRQTQGFRVSCFTRSPARRDAVCGAVDAGFAGMMDAFGNLTEFLSLPDGSAAWIKYRSTYTDDKPGKDTVWRRDLCYTVEYATTLAQIQPTALFVAANMAAQGGLTMTGAADLGPTFFFDLATQTVLLAANDAVVGTAVPPTYPSQVLYSSASGDVLTDGNANLAGQT